MARISNNHRLQIPTSLINQLHLNGKVVGIFWDANEKSIYISDLVDSSDEYCLGIRSLDIKNRIYIPEKILELIDSKDALFVIALKGNRIYIFNRDYPNQQSV